jgi:hypothetical protein
VRRGDEAFHDIHDIIVRFFFIFYWRFWILFIPPSMWSRCRQQLSTRHLTLLFVNLIFFAALLLNAFFFSCTFPEVAVVLVTVLIEVMQEMFVKAYCLYCPLLLFPTSDLVVTSIGLDGASFRLSSWDFKRILTKSARQSSTRSTARSIVTSNRVGVGFVDNPGDLNVGL